MQRSVGGCVRKLGVREHKGRPYILGNCDSHGTCGAINPGMNVQIASTMNCLLHSEFPSLSRASLLFGSLNVHRSYFNLKILVI